MTGDFEATTSDITLEQCKDDFTRAHLAWLALAAQNAALWAFVRASDAISAAESLEDNLVAFGDFAEARKYLRQYEEAP
jgi:hypothetical protein